MPGFSAQGLYAGAPNTFRGIPCGLSSDDAGKLIAYGTGNNAVARSIENPNEVIVCSRHTSQVTCARLSPSGALCASGDKDGNVIVWATRADTMEKLSFKALGGAIRDIAWSDDQERLIAVGEGKSGYANVFTITGNTIGNICGHSQAIVSCDFKKSRPYRVVTGGQDSLVAFFEGPPFKFKHTLPGHKATVNCIKYSPDGSTIATVSGLADIILLDGATGDRQRSITTDHAGTIMGVAWSKDGSLLATCSTDATIKLWKSADGSKVAETAAPAKKTINDHVLGVTILPDGRVVGVTLGGEVTFYSADLKAVTGSWRGHGRPVVALQPPSAANGGRLITVGVDSRVYSWAPAGASSLVQFPSAETDVLAAQVSVDGKSMLAVANTDIVECTLSGAGDSTVRKLATQTGGAVGLVVLNSGLICILQKQMMYVFNKAGEKKHDIKLLKFDASSIAAFGETVLVGGEHGVKIFNITPGAIQEKAVFTAGHEQAVVTAVAISADGALVASGDSTRRIVVWRLEDLSVVQDGLMYHSGRISALAFDPTSSARLLSGSFDCSFALWDVPNRKKVASEDGAHRNGVTAVAFAAEGTVNTAGADGNVRTWAVTA